jgi:hypothetical protein
MENANLCLRKGHKKLWLFPSDVTGNALAYDLVIKKVVLQKSATVKSQEVHG